MTTDRAILLVEDNEDDIFIMKMAFKDAGVTNPLYIVEDGQEALDYLAGNGKFGDRKNYPLPVVVFLDLKLPLMSGHDVLAWIRRREDFASMVVVVLTSSAEPEDLRRAYDLGTNSYLVKPPTVEQLSEMAKVFKWYWLEYNQFATI